MVVRKRGKMTGNWICHECGLKYGRPKNVVSTWHVELCDYCGKIESVTEPRDYGYPELPKESKEK